MSRGILSWGDFVLGGILSRGILSGGFCPGGFCPGGFCPDTAQNASASLLLCRQGIPSNQSISAHSLIFLWKSDLPTGFFLFDGADCEAVFDKDCNPSP